MEIFRQLSRFGLESDAMRQAAETEKTAQWQSFLQRWEWRRISTWRRMSLLCIAIFTFVGSLFIPVFRDVDPGRASEGILFLVLGFRAASKSELPTSVVVAGGCLAALVSALNHKLLVSPSWIWTPLAFILLAFVMFWGRRGSNKSLAQ
jgi:hypothetical protein